MRAWYAVQIYEPPLGQRRSQRGVKPETEGEAFARAIAMARNFQAAATLWCWDGVKWVHLPWSWVNLKLFRELQARATGNASKTWG